MLDIGIGRYQMKIPIPATLVIKGILALSDNTDRNHYLALSDDTDRIHFLAPSDNTDRIHYLAPCVKACDNTERRYFTS